MYAFRRLSAVAIPAVFAVVSAGPALATEGYFQNGNGARQKALAGAGVADSRDATAASLNPAGLVHVENQVNVSLSGFVPRRKLVGSGPPGFTPDGQVGSDSNIFAIPNIAASYRLQNNALIDVLGFTIVGNGGLNTNYPAPVRGPFPTPTGVFFDGPAGVNLTQTLISVAAAKQFGSVSVGIAPIVALQAFEARGIASFAPLSSDPANLSSNDTDISYGFGVRAGIEFAATSSIRLGVAGNSRIYMTEFDDYRGLFAEQGDFDIPASIQAGIAIDIMPSLTIMVDYKHIWYGDIAAIANPSTSPGLLGADNGPGFGWNDIDIVKVGLEYRPNDDVSVRFGYSYNENPIESADVLFNILAPGVVQQHFTAGMRYALSQNWEFEVAGLYVPEVTVSGPEIAPGNPGHNVEISLRQYEVTFGLTYKFGQQTTDTYK